MNANYLKIPTAIFFISFATFGMSGIAYASNNNLIAWWLLVASSTILFSGLAITIALIFIWWFKEDWDKYD